MKIYKITEASEYLGVSINTLKTLANIEYLQSIYRVLKPEGCALVMFANWPQHGLTLPNAKQFANKRHDSTQVNWYYNDIDLAKSAVTTAGFKSFENILPNFRDTLAVLRKD